MEDYRQSSAYCNYFSKKGWSVDTIDDTKVLVKKLPVLGSFVKIQRGSPHIPLNKIEEVCKKHRALVSVIEPDVKTCDGHYFEVEKNLKSAGYRNLNLILSPTKTIHINLEKPEEEILSSFDQDIRRGIKRNFKKELIFDDTAKLDDFYLLLSKVGKSQKVNISNKSDWLAKWSAFGENLKVVMVYCNNELLGGNMFTVGSPISYGIFLPITSLGRQHRIAANLIWEALLVAKNSGSKTFDLNGIYDARFKLPKNWEGLTAFKRKFNGEEVEFMHAKIKVHAWYLKPLGWLGLLWIHFVDS